MIYVYHEFWHRLNDRFYIVDEVKTRVECDIPVYLPVSYMLISSIPQSKSHDILRQMSWHQSHDIGALTFYKKLTFGKDEGKLSQCMRSIFVKWHRWTFPFNRNISSLLENQYETLAKHRCGNLSSPTCDVTMHKMVVTYNSNVRENSIVQWNVSIHRLPTENVITMSPVLVGRNFSSVDILLTYTCVPM